MPAGARDLAACTRACPGVGTGQLTWNHGQQVPLAVRPSTAVTNSPDGTAASLWPWPQALGHTLVYVESAERGREGFTWAAWPLGTSLCEWGVPRVPAGAPG